MSGGGRFDFDDGGTYCGGWEDGKAHGHGVCTGPKGQGEYSGAWLAGFEASGVYMWPSGNSYKGQWTQGKRHGIGVEIKGRWIYRGEWNTGFKGRYGSRHSTASGAKYEGTWTTGLQDGYGVETYADGDPSAWSAMGHSPDTPPPRGTYQGQWLRGMRHGYGVRQSVPYGLASHYRPKALRASLTTLRSEAEEDRVVKDRDRKVDESRGGFVLKARSDESPSQRRRSIFDKQGRSSLRKSLLAGLKLKKQKSTGDIQDSPRRTTGSVRSTISNISHVSADSSQSGVTNASIHTDSNLSFVSQDDITDANVTETYMGEWKNDKRCGFGISERSDGLKYEGEWYNNKKYGYGVTTFKDGTKEEGKYKNNVLISSGKKSKLFLIRSSKLRERVDNAVAAAQRAAQIAHQKADIAISRQANARAKAEQADLAAENSQKDSELARIKAKEFAPEFHQPGTDFMKKQLLEQGGNPDETQDGEPSTYPSPHRRQRSLQDCALASSSSHIGESLHKLNDPDQHHQQHHVGVREPSMERHRMSRENMVPHHLHNHQQQPAHPSSMSSQHHNRIPHSSGPPRRHDRDRLPPDTYSNSSYTPMDQDYNHSYKTRRDDSGLGRDMDSPEGRYRDSREAHSPSSMDRSPDSGLSDSDDLRYRNRPMQRRKTLPSIVKRVPPPAAAAAPAGTTGNQVQKTSTDKTKSVVTPKPVEPETYVIENGIRKRVKAEVYAQPPPVTTSDDNPSLPNRYKLESQGSLSKGANRGSLPDVRVCNELGKNVMPREEVSHLSERRRAELRKMREEAEKRKQQEIVLRLADLKDWCQQRQLLMLVIAVNVSLATMFFNLLSQ